MGTKSVLLSLLSEAFTIYELSRCSFTTLVLSWRRIFAPARIANFLELGGSARDLEFLVRLCVSEIVSMLVHGAGTKLVWNLCSCEHCQFP